MGELNQIYNFQDTIFLCEIFENRADLFKSIFKYNPRKCNIASSFSGCVHRNKRKCCIALPTDAKYVRAFEKSLIGAFSCINTRLAFDTNILLKEPDREKVLIELNFDGKKVDKKVIVHYLKNGREQSVWYGYDETIALRLY